LYYRINIKGISRPLLFLPTRINPTLKMHRRTLLYRFSPGLHPNYPAYYYLLFYVKNYRMDCYQVACFNVTNLRRGSSVRDSNLLRQIEKEYFIFSLSNFLFESSPKDHYKYSCAEGMTRLDNHRLKTGQNIHK
jgi:hypothetical protein